MKILDYKKNITTDIGGIEAALTQLLKGKKVLILFDNVNSRHQADLLQRCCEGRGPGSLILFTCRDFDNLGQLPPQCKHQVELLSEGAAFDLICEKAGLGMIERKSDIGQAIDVAAKACGGLPLALEILGSYVSGKELLAWKVEHLLVAFVTVAARAMMTSYTNV